MRFSKLRTFYQWVYQGISATERFGCRDGEKGVDGQNGRPGENGQYGQFWLIPRADIPQEVVQRSGELKALLGQTVQLVKNIWIEKQDPRTQISPTSNVPNNYTYLQSTERPQFRLEWAAPVPPGRLGVASAEIGVVVEASSGQAKIVLDIPGTLDYTESVKNGVEVATVTGGFSPSRVESFRIERVTSSNGKSQLVLVDEGDLRGLIPQSTIEVMLLTKQSASGLETPDYQRRNSVKFVISPNSTGLLSNNTNVEGNVYTLNVGSSFGMWLKPDYEAQYIVNVQQTTNSGAVYNQIENVEFRVGST